MDLAIRKYNFIKELTTVDEKLMEKLEQFLRTYKKEEDWFDNLSSEEQKEIKAGLKQAENNELVSHETIVKKFEKWH